MDRTTITLLVVLVGAWLLQIFMSNWQMRRFHRRSQEMRRRGTEMAVGLAHRSVATLPLRVSRLCATALQLASFLTTQRPVSAVHYPGLSTHPGHAIAKSQMDAFGTIVSFELRTREEAEQFLRSLTLVREATSFGGVHSMAERRARWGGDAIGEGFIRFSVGCEAPDDILEDVAQALRSL